MKITWLGHSGFRIEIGGKVLLIDPWLTGNPAFPEGREAEATEGATHIFMTHAHFDHMNGVVDLAEQLKAPIVGQFDLMSFLDEQNPDLETVGFNKGGTVDLDGVAVTMVNAIHSNSMATETGPWVPGTECGFIIRGDGHCIYVSGDTDVMADMEVIADRYKPDLGILCAGGHFTMDMEGAAYAANRYFDFKIVIPCHYKTFPLLAQDAAPLRARMPVGTRLIEPEVLAPITI
jgi:L-ascorbate metabolism protein UlaG (beta-lactamase superfamily)